MYYTNSGNILVVFMMHVGILGILDILVSEWYSNSPECREMYHNKISM